MMELTKLENKELLQEYDDLEWNDGRFPTSSAHKKRYEELRAELLRRLSGSGAAVSASPNDNLLTALKVIAIALKEPAGGEFWSARKFLDDRGIFNGDLDGERVLLKVAQAAIAEFEALPASPGPRPVCPKCGGDNGDVSLNQDDAIFAVCLECKEKWPLCEWADFAQFFPASLNGEKRADMVDVEVIAKEAATEIFAKVFSFDPIRADKIEKIILRSISRGEKRATEWIRLPQLPPEDEKVLIAVMAEADDHSTGMTVRFPEVYRGTIYEAPGMVIADCEGSGEYEDEEILGWQPLPVPPVAATTQGTPEGTEKA